MGSSESGILVPGGDVTAGLPKAVFRFGGGAWVQEREGCPARVPSACRAPSGRPRQAPFPTQALCSRPLRRLDEHPLRAAAWTVPPQPPPSLSEVRRAWWTSAVRAQPAMDGPCCRGAGPRWPGGRQGASPWRPRAEMVRLWAARGGRRPRGRRQFPLPCRWPVRRRCQPCTTFCSGPSRVRKVPPAGLGEGGPWGGRRVPVGSP